MHDEGKTGPDPSELSERDRQMMDTGGEDDNPELELSPESIEQIMEKVQDINEYGTAYKTICRSTEVENEDLPISPQKRNALIATLREGELGTEKIQMGQEYSSPWKYYGGKRGKESWREVARNKNFIPKVYFNILGRSEHEKYGISQAHYCQSHEQNVLVLTLIFDLKPYYDAGPNAATWISERDWRPHRFFTCDASIDTLYPTLKAVEEVYGQNCTDYNEYRDWINKKAIKSEEQFKKMCERTKQIMVEREKKSTFDLGGRAKGEWQNFDSQCGFILTPRIPPRFFTGIILDRHPELGTSDAGGVANLMTETNRDNPDRLFPIYDIHGNLLWPKQMTYAEVKEFVEQKKRKT